MSKIICDVCGTSYPDTATQCPICGSVRPGEVAGVCAGAETPESQQTAYTYVKGGRFSKANVKKRNQGKVYAPEDLSDGEEPMQETRSNKGLVIAVVLLLLAIIAVVGYIVVQMYGPNFRSGSAATGGVAASVATTTQPVETTEETEPAPTQEQILCTEVTASLPDRRPLKKKNESFLLNVDLKPKNTTETVEFLSSDENIATVNQDGKVTAVGSGEATITILCGNAVTQVTVICEIEEEEKEEVETPEYTAADLVLNRDDMTLKKKKEQHQLYNGKIPKDKITWTSDNEKVATVKNGLVTAVGKGMTTIHAEFDGVKVSCIVRCADSVGAYEEPTEEQQPDTDYKISHTDVTLEKGKTFNLTLTDKEGQIVTVTWTPADPTICTAEGNVIIANETGITTVTAIYEDVPYSCIVRVP